MSMRIHDDGLAAAAASQSAPANGPIGLGSGSSRQSGSVSNLGADQVDISSLSGNVAATSAALANQQAARVSQLAALYAKGDYHVDSMQLSRALISGSMAGGSVEGNS
jgi:hypothetical protein